MRRDRVIPAIPQRVVTEELISLTLDYISSTVTVIVGEVQDGVAVNHRSVTLGSADFQRLAGGLSAKQNVFHLIDLQETKGEQGTADAVAAETGVESEEFSGAEHTGETNA